VALGYFQDNSLGVVAAVAVMLVIQFVAIGVGPRTVGRQHAQRALRRVFDISSEQDGSRAGTEGRRLLDEALEEVKESVALEKLEHGGDISEDDLQRAEKDLQKLTDRFVTDIDQIQGHKEQELMEV